MKNTFTIVLGLSLMLLLLGFGNNKSEQEYKASTNPINYEELSHNPQTLNNKALYLTGKIIYVKEIDNHLQLVLTGQTETPVWISYTKQRDENSPQLGQTLQVWGNFEAINSHKILELMPDTRMFDIRAQYIQIL